MPATKITLDDAKPDKLFYFVVNVVPIRKSDGRALILKRSKRETAHPGRYGVVGGKLEHNDLDLNKPSRINGDVLDFEEAIPNLARREAMEEAGINLGSELRYINQVTFVRPDGVPVVLLKFAAEYDSGKVKLEEDSFSDFAWVNAEEVKEYPTIDGVADEIATAISLFAK